MLESLQSDSRKQSRRSAASAVVHPYSDPTPAEAAVNDILSPYLLGLGEAAATWREDIACTRFTLMVRDVPLNFGCALET